MEQYPRRQLSSILNLFNGILSTASLKKDEKKAVSNE
jgi:hypothetical protein